MALDAVQWQRISALFTTIRALPEAERGAALSALEGSDAALRDDVAQLLAADVDDAFLAAPVSLASGAMPSSATSGPRRIGPYEVLRQVGRGGMGVVHAARHTTPSLDRVVAIKTLPLGFEYPEMAWRFTRERELLARLAHPNIARLYDGGTTDEGVPYLVMEFVDGMRIDSWCDRAQLSIAARLDLFQQVCAAVQHAHTQLIVHRDLKPTNVLVTPDGEVKLLDFGIAKLTSPRDGTEITRGPSSPMTPAYASPEQRRGGDVTTASDIYSLGVLLHRLLTGTVPRTEGTGGVTAPTRPPSELLTDEHAATCAGLDPHTIRKTLRGDLDAIMLMALREDPTRRYSSAEALRHDVQRYLKGRPVLAKPDTLTYRLGKFVQRQRALSATLVIAVLAVAGGVTSYTINTRKALAEARQTQRVARVLQQLIGAGASERFRSPPSLLTVLDSARTAIAKEFASEPLARAMIYAELGGTYFSFERPDLAALMFDSARVLFSETRGPQSIEAVSALSASVWPVASLGLADSAFARQQQSVRGFRALLPASQRQLTEAEIELAFQELALRNSVDSALPRMRSALARERTDTAPRWDIIALGEAATIMPSFYRQQPLVAESAFVRSVAALARLKTPSQAQRTALAFQGQSLLLRNRPREAVPILRSMLAKTEVRFGAAHYLTAQAQNLLARALLAGGSLDESRILIDSAITNNERAATRDHLYLGEMYLTRANVAAAQRDWPRAMESLERAGQQRDQLGAQRPMLDVAIGYTTAAVREARGDLRGAQSAFEDAVAQARKGLAAGTRNRGLAEANLAAFLQRHPSSTAAR